MVRIIFLSMLMTVSVLSQQSPDGTYRVEQERKVTHDIDDEQLVTYTVYDRGGREFYSVTREVTYDAAFPSVGLFNSGILALVDSFSGIVEFYDTGGELIRSINFPDAEDVEHERKIDFSFHEDRVAFLISEPGINYVRLAIYDERGNLHIKENIDAHHGTGIMHSPDGSLLVVGMYAWIGKSVEYKSYFISNDGVIMGRVEAGFERGSFSEDGTGFLAFSNSSVHHIDVNDQTVLWSYKTEEEKMIIDAKWNTDGIVVLSSIKPALIEGRWKYQDPVVKTLDKEAGGLISEQNFPGVTFTTGTFERENEVLKLLLDTSLYPIER